MSNTAFSVVCILIPFVGTTLGALTVFFLGREPSVSLQKFLLGFASGVMVAASVWSLLIPAIEMAGEQGVKLTWFPASVGFIIGMLFLMVTDALIPHFDSETVTRNCTSHKQKRSAKMFFAVTLHNIPEGMAVGVVLAGFLAGKGVVEMAGVMALAIGVAIQNFPEGAIVSMPGALSGQTRKRAFFYAFLSGAVEPVFALVTLALTAIIYPALPYLLSFAAGAMIYVVVEELIPEAHEGKHSHYANFGVAMGFALMMLLDVALS